MASTSVQDRPADGELLRTGRGRLRATVVVIILTALAGGWWLLSGHQRDQLIVRYDARPLECANGELPIADLDVDPEPFYVAVLDAAADMDCTLRVHVENGSRFAARLQQVAMPYYGPGTGAAIHARVLLPFGSEPVRDDPDQPALPHRDATFALDHPIEAGERLTLQIRLQHAPEGCMSPGAMMWSDDEILLRASVLGRRGTSVPPGPTFVQRGTQDSSCDEG